MPMGILVLGLCRTGTTSMCLALKELGYHDVYHMKSAYANDRDVELWIKALEAKYEGNGTPFRRKQWDQLLGHCMAVTDVPCAFFAAELIDAYPDALVILTTRSVESWYASMMQTVWAVYQDRLRWLIAKFNGPTSRRRRLSDLFFLHVFRGDFPRFGKRVFVEHNEHVRGLVPPERLLEFQARQGWGPLCEFLGKEIPDGKQFPKVNDVTTFRATFHEMNQAVYSQTGRLLVKTAIPVLFIAGAIYYFVGMML